ncbi:MAG TPA: MBL fold metallo-hydrolase [Cyanobacteria bacterium UBA11691]|nr:MBL fold metallo-hydrolase [Cyanobacteria bacterium UBA11691]
MSDSLNYIRFWGVRGSYPAPFGSHMRVGGNTSCVEIRADDHILVCDGGSGIIPLGNSLMAQQDIKELMIIITHYHWDHIQGVPFFMPLFTPGNQIHVWGDVPDSSESLEDHFHHAILHVNSPVPSPIPKADLKFSQVSPGDRVTLDDIEIETGHLNHPNGAMGYRITWQGHTAVYCTDTEHYSDRLDEDVLKLARDADILIYDAMYTDNEYSNPKSPKVGWGHSTWQEGVKVAQAAGVKKLIIFHHEPNHDDDTLDQIEEEVQHNYPNTILAREGMILSLIEA